MLWQSIIFSFNFRFTTAVKIVWELSKIQCLTWLFKHPNTLIWSWLPGHPNLIKIPKTAVKNLWEFSNRKRIETCALQKCKVLRDYENAPWQPLWLSSHEFMTAVGTIEDLHIFCLVLEEQMKRVTQKWMCIMQATFCWYNNYMRATISSRRPTIGWRLLNHIKTWVIIGETSFYWLGSNCSFWEYQFLF